MIPNQFKVKMSKTQYSYLYKAPAIVFVLWLSRNSDLFKIFSICLWFSLDLQTPLYTWMFAYVIVTHGLLQITSSTTNARRVCKVTAEKNEWDCYEAWADLIRIILINAITFLCFLITSNETEMKPLLTSFSTLNLRTKTLIILVSVGTLSILIIRTIFSLVTIEQGSMPVKLTF